MLQADSVTSVPVAVTSDVNPFDVLKGIAVMKVINSELVPLMIATNNVETAADHFQNIIASNEA